MKVSSFLHCALRSPDPVRIGKFYADLFESGFFIHPVLAGLGIVMVKLANPESVYRGILRRSPRYHSGRRLLLRGIYLRQSSGTFPHAGCQTGQSSGCIDCYSTGL